MKWRLPGPQVPAQAVRRPVSSASARCREGAGLLVPHVDPIDLAAVDGVGDPVQRVADDPIARLYAGGLQRLDYDIGDSFPHCGTSCRQFFGSDPMSGPRASSPPVFFPYPPMGGRRSDLGDDGPHAARD